MEVTLKEVYESFTKLESEIDTLGIQTLVTKSNSLNFKITKLKFKLELEHAEIESELEHVSAEIHKYFKGWSSEYGVSDVIVSGYNELKRAETSNNKYIECKAKLNRKNAELTVISDMLNCLNKNGYAVNTLIKLKELRL